MNQDLSVIMAGIRVEKWLGVWQSIRAAWSGRFELFIVGPEPPGEDVTDRVMWMGDWGSPVRCYQRALQFATAPLLVWAFDDGLFEPGALDESARLLKAAGGLLNAVAHRYLEGDVNTDNMRADEYYTFGHHDHVRDMHIPGEYKLLNSGMTYTATARAVGGWDSQFEAPAAAWADFAARLQNSGVAVVLQDGIAVKFGHLPGPSGDHGPIHHAQIEHDLPLFQKIWRDPAAKERRAVPLDNWRQSPERWERRFGKAP